MGNEFLKVGGDFAEQGGDHARGHRDDAGEDARQETVQVTEGHRAIDAPRRSGREVLLGGQIGCQSVEVIADHFGTGVLPPASE